MKPMSRNSTIRAVVETVVPMSSDLDELAWPEVLTIVETVASERPPKMRRQLAAFIRVVEYAALPFHGRRFTRLSLADRTRWLLRLQDSSIPLVRRGLWGLRTLAFMGYYGRAQAASEIGYTASASGWEVRPPGEREGAE